MKIENLTGEAILRRLKNEKLYVLDKGIIKKYDCHSWHGHFYGDPFNVLILSNGVVRGKDRTVTLRLELDQYKKQWSFNEEDLL